MIIQTKKLALLLLSSALLLSACDADVALTSRAKSDPIQIQANFSQTDAGRQLILNDPQNLPPALTTANEVKVIWDNSGNLYPVQRSANGGLILNVPAARFANSQGKITFFLLDDQSRSYFVEAQTGPLVILNSPAFVITPTSAPIVGSRVQIKANLPSDFEVDQHRFLWSFGVSRQGPWQNISGQGPEVSWETPQAGNYFIRLEIQNKSTLIKSEVITPTAAITVLDVSGLVTPTPSNGTVVLGQSIELTSPRATATTQWLFSPSPVGPFQPIEEQGQNITWEPPAIGQYYIQLQNTDAQGETTTLTTADPVVRVEQADGVVVASQSQVVRGESVTLTAQAPDDLSISNLSYQWAFSSSPQGPFSPIVGRSKTIQWYPDQTGSFFFRVRLLDQDSGEERTFVSNKSLVSVIDSDANFQVTQTNIIKGQRTRLSFLKDSTQNIRWFYGASPQGPFFSISGEGKTIEWQPPQAGQFYLRAELPLADRAPAQFTSATALVSVTESNSVLQASPARSRLGQVVNLSANVPEKEDGQTYAWFVGPSPVGPWQAAQTLQKETNKSTLAWMPGQEGNFYVKVDVFTPSTQSLVSFVSPAALSLVSENNFIITNPTPANIGTQGAVKLSASFIKPNNNPMYYSWSASPSPQGPFISIGGSFQPSIEWKQPGQTGQYYIRFNAIDQQTQRHVSFTTSQPLVFVTESQTSLPRF